MSHVCLAVKFWESIEFNSKTEIKGIGTLSFFRLFGELRKLFENLKLTESKRKIRERKNPRKRIKRKWNETNCIFISNKGFSRGTLITVRVVQILLWSNLAQRVNVYTWNPRRSSLCTLKLSSCSKLSLLYISGSTSIQWAFTGKEGPFKGKRVVWSNNSGNRNSFSGPIVPFVASISSWAI